MDFGSLYSYNQSDGTVSVIPDTSAIKEKVVSAFTSIFGSDVSTDDTTPMGRFIEAITLLFVDVLGVNAQNANAFNPNCALGSHLDALGKIWNVTRLSGESDYSYRTRILKSQSRGNGYCESIRSAVSNVEDVVSCCVLDNNTGDVVVKNAKNEIATSSEGGISLPAHSVYISVGGSGYSDADVAEAIYKTKSAGCAYQNDSSHGTLVTQTITDEDTGSVNSVIFHRATEKPVEVQVSVVGSMFTGTDIVSATKSAIANLVNSSGMATLTSSMIIAAIAADGSGIVCSSATLTSGGTAEDPIRLMPYQYFNIEDSDITVTVE